MIAIGLGALLATLLAASAVPAASEGAKFSALIEIDRGGIMTSSTQIRVDLASKTLALSNAQGSHVLGLSDGAIAQIHQAAVDLLASPEIKKTCMPSMDSGGSMRVEVGEQRYGSEILRGCQTHAEERLEAAVSCAAYPDTPSSTCPRP